MNSSGDITESGAISAALLTGSSSGNANFSGINSISALGDFAATGDFILRNGAAFSVVGTVTAGPVTPPGPNSGNINTISLTSAAGTLAIGTVGSIGVLDAGNVVLSAAGTISEPNGTIIANTLTAATTTSGDITLSSTGNAVTTVTGANATNGNVALVFGPTTTLTGSYKGNNLFFEAAGTGDTLKIGDAATGVAMSATAASNPRISLVADFITEGSQPNTITAKGGTVELAPFTSGRGVSLAGTAGGHLLIDGTLLNDISTNTGTVVVGQFTDVPNSGTLNASGGNLSIDGAVSLAGIASTLDLVSQGSITETAGPLFVGSLIGNAASGTLLATGNSIGTVAFTATNGDVQIVDGASAERRVGQRAERQYLPGVIERGRDQCRGRQHGGFGDGPDWVQDRRDIGLRHGEAEQRYSGTGAVQLTRNDHPRRSGWFVGCQRRSCRRHGNLVATRRGNGARRIHRPPRPRTHLLSVARSASALSRSSWTARARSAAAGS